MNTGRQETRGSSVVIIDLTLLNRMMQKMARKKTERLPPSNKTVEEIVLNRRLSSPTQSSNTSTSPAALTVDVNGSQTFLSQAISMDPSNGYSLNDTM